MTAETRAFLDSFRARLERVAVEGEDAIRELSEERRASRTDSTT